jgi:hypothetical protein
VANIGRPSDALRKGADRITREHEESSAAWHRWWREPSAAERNATVSSHNEGKSSAEATRRVECDID